MEEGCASYSFFSGGMGWASYYLLWRLMERRTFRSCRRLYNPAEKPLAFHQNQIFRFDPIAFFEEFKIGVMLRQAREQAGVTQEKLALITKTKKSAISRLENHAEDVRLSTVVRVARALGKTLRMELVGAKS
jgi:DNA-binding XRE family transcriptional regulator